MLEPLKISSAAIGVMLGLNGLAAGAALAGCCAQMIGFAVMSIDDNDIGDVIAKQLTLLNTVPQIL